MVDEALDELGRREGYTRLTAEHPEERRWMTREEKRAELESWCAQTGLSTTDLLNGFAKILAIEFHEGRATYEFCDMVVNNLFEPIIEGVEQVIEGQSGTKLAWDVYLAFDAGEYYRAGETPGSTGPDERTARLIADIVKRLR